MKKSQLSVFVIMGLVIIIILGFFTFTLTTKGQNQLSSATKDSITGSVVKSDAEKMIISCIDYSVKKVISETGIREDTLESFEQLMKSEIISCTSTIIENMRQMSYEITEGELTLNAEINPETIILDISYPILIEKDLKKIQLNEFHYSFDRSVSIYIHEGISDKEEILISKNEKAELIIPEGIKITDEKGNSVEKIGLKVEDVHSGGMENKVIIGQLIYEGFPDKISFSEPIQLSIEFDENDFPNGYTTDNLRIAYWDEEDLIWYALPTQIEDNKAIANISHFTTLGISFGNPVLIQTLIFEERFKPYGGGPEGSNSGVWNITGKEGSNEGKVILQPGFSSINDVMSAYSNYEDYTETRKKMIEGGGDLPSLKYGYFLNPENPKDNEFINCEEYDSRNLGEYTYFISEGLPWLKTKETGEDEFGWHNLQCAGGIIRPKNGNSYSEYVLMEPKGNSVIAISDSKFSKLLFNVYAYPMKDTINDKYLIENIKELDLTSQKDYPFYCEIIPYSEDTLINMSSSEEGRKYEIYGINAVKKTDHFAARTEMHSQCEVFWYYWGNGIKEISTPEEITTIYKGKDIKTFLKIMAEVMGAAFFREDWFSEMIQ